MSKRVVRRYKDTSAKGDSSKIEGNRHFIRVDLVSLKMEERTEIGLRSEIFFRTGKTKLKRGTRSPSNGSIYIEKNEVFKPAGGLNLYSEFIDQEDGDVVINFQIFENDVGKDDEILETKLNIKIGQNKDYLSFSENGAKIKIAVSGKKTRF
ncbi:MAG: hypothetical protein OEY49_10890 [Candidatus Heimdallarchaeota archaeon]|nr:hypothetical protein [Candidatus Heimdallarchaeota archaeon]